MGDTPEMEERRRRLEERLDWSPPPRCWVVVVAILSITVLVISVALMLS